MNDKSKIITFNNDGDKEGGSGLPINLQKKKFHSQGEYEKESWSAH